MTRTRMLWMLIALVGPLAALAAEPELKTRITDVTVFKDGHALVLASGTVELKDGWARTRDVPVPVLGTFWAFVADKEAKVDFVKAGFVETQETRPCLSFDEMIQANVGKEVEIVEQPKDAPPQPHRGVLQGILQHKTSREVEASRSIPARRDRFGNYISGRKVREAREDTSTALAAFVMLKTDTGVVLIPRTSIRSIAIRDKDVATTHTETKKVREISMHVTKDGKPLAGRHELGMVYLQRGIRWIPNYRIQLLDDGKAHITLQGTIINELADVENADFRLVVGVPTFIMKGATSPVALRESALQLSAFFRPPSQSGRGSQFDYLSNVIMSQRAMPTVREAPVAGGPDIPAEGQTEDLFLFQREGLTLKKGESAVIHLMEVTVPYEDIYVWDIPPVPPRELWRSIGRDQQRELLRSLTGAKAMHKIRLTNKGKTPWTTGPAAIFRGDTPLGQHLMTYTSIGNSVDVTITVATDLNTKRHENEVSRKHNDLRISTTNFTKHVMKGKLTVTNFKARPVRVIVKRQVIGTITAATLDGKILVSSFLEEATMEWGGRPWWWWRWPWWYARANAMANVTWDTTIPKGKAVAFEYDWYYHTHP